ncbi:MAG: response regulator transcription factor, partial [Prolixibacteraceae bacterium]|nr:response regulator transcription factor [Prolixibacteraceae bacterium]
MINAVIIDDEPAMQELNSRLLTEYFPEINLSGIAGSVKSAVELIKNVKPELVLMDIQIEGGTGFQVLQQLKPYTFKVVFITGFDSFAIKAIRFSALDYILKPVDEKEFQLAINRALDTIKFVQNNSLQTEILMESYKKETQNKKLVLKTTKSIHIVDISEIMFCQSDNSYTTFYTIDNEKIVVSKSIKEYEDLLNEYGFLRPHQSYLVN